MSKPTPIHPANPHGLDQPRPEQPHPYTGKKRGRKPGTPNRPKPASVALVRALQPLLVDIPTTASLLSMSESYVWKQIRLAERNPEEGLESTKLGSRRRVYMHSIRRLLGLDTGSNQP